jgi:hypothetical protein
VEEAMPSRSIARPAFGGSAPTTAKSLVARLSLAGLVGLVTTIGAATGCSSSKTATPASSDEGITFTKTIEPLVQDKCQTCHREGGIAPFPLVTYEDVKAMGAIAKDKVANRQMPPWGAFDDDECTMQRKFRDDLSLTQEQVDTFVSWVDDGMPLGDPTKRIAPKTFTENRLVDKTNTYALAEPYMVEATGKDDIRCFPLDPGFAENTWVGGSNIIPGDPKVVHHVIVFIDPDGEGTTLAEGKSNYSCFGGPRLQKQSLLLAWAPGVPPTRYGEDSGLKVPKGARLVMQVHYHPGRNGETVADKTTIELKTLATKPKYMAEILLVGNVDGGQAGVTKLLPGPNDPSTGPTFLIPSNAKNHTETMEAIIPAKNGFVQVPPLNVYAVGTHMHWAGVDMEIEVERKQPTPEQPAHECLLGTPKYDFNWQRHYVYDAPLDKLPVVSPGDKLRFRCTFDNTTDNPHVARSMAEQRMNKPPQIRLGETTNDEMCQGILVVVSETSFRE